MKNNIILFVSLYFLFLADLNAQTPYYYYYEGRKQYLSLDTEHAFISFKEQMLPVDIRQRNIKTTDLQSDKSDTKQYQMQKGTSRYWTELSFGERLSDENYLKNLSDIKHQNKDVIISPYFKINDNDKIGLSNFFYVKLKTDKDTTLLKQMAEKTKSIIIEQDMFMPLWFVLSTTEASELNAMECSNVFYESGVFQAAEPNLMVDIVQCANDQYFSQQWGLRNIGLNGGTNGIDIKGCNAWQISRGNNVTVAVIDHGIELNHPDLVGNMHSLSYDSENRTSPSIVRGNHGTACAGIVGAIQNGIGISGVAPNCRLMSISSSLDLNTLNIQQHLAAGINWAWQNGADVISNSWGHNALTGSFITDAINNAVTNGRGGKGCVVVFASGNDNASSVNYPASLPNVIAVGAVDRCGIRSGRIDIVPNSCDPWGQDSYPGSAYGTALSVVAPGTNVYTTDRQGSAGYNTASGTAGDYDCCFGGTSAACPHVAGVAALVLSANPNLTALQVRNIIESTAQKVGGYGYHLELGRHNGTWDYEMGYGLVNAHAAVSAAIATILGPDNLCGTIGIYKLNSDFPSVSWSVTPTNAFTIIDSDATSATITTSALNGQAGTVTAVVNGVNITRTISVCNVAIIGPYTVCDTGIYTVSQNALTMWSVAPENAFSIAANFSSATVATKMFNESGTLTATMAGATFTKVIQACNVDISGPSIICVTGAYELSDGYHAASWSVTPSDAFTITASDATSATVTATMANGQSGTLTAMVNGVSVKKVISVCRPLIHGPLGESCTSDYVIFSLPPDISQANWVITDSSKLRIIQDNGANGCLVERVPFYSYSNDDPFETPPITYYPYAEAILTFQYEWNGNSYSVSKTIWHGINPSIAKIFDINGYMTFDNMMGDILENGASYYFTSNTIPPYPIIYTSPYQYRWVVTPQGIPESPSIYSGKSTINQPANFTVAGAYILSLSVTDGCGRSEKAYRPFTVTERNIYLITPNPVSDYLLFTKLLRPDTYKCPRIGGVKIFNIQSGAVVFQQSGYNFCGDFTIDVSSIPNGLYLVCLEMNGRVIQHQNILIQH